jgi:hypothetical protein
MSGATESVLREVYENWPAFVYIGLTIGFSICFLRERRSETQALREMGAAMHYRIDRIERILNQQCLENSRQPGAVEISKPERRSALNRANIPPKHHDTGRSFVKKLNAESTI